MTTATCVKKKSSSHFRVPEELVKRADGQKAGLPTYRSEFMRDRDRLMYATAFRRLAGKTQIYTVSAVDDHRKNRLTHTLEVAQIARTIARALELDEDLAEAIALGHDLGHTPFGHAGEEMLHKVMSLGSDIVENSPFNEKDIANQLESSGYDVDYLERACGFKHNIQSVRVATLLEDSYRDNQQANIGLNLTNYTLYGMMSHSKMEYKTAELRPHPSYQNEFSDALKVQGYDTDAWSFEAFIVEFADDIAQWHHDLEDALLDGVMPIGEICDTINRALEKAFIDQGQHERSMMLKEIGKTGIVDRRRVAQLSNIVVDTLVTDLVKTSESNFQKLLGDLEDAIRAGGIAKAVTTLFSNYKAFSNKKNPKDAFFWVINFSENVIRAEFKNTIGEWIHHSRNVERMNVKGQYIIRKLFAAYARNPQQLPDGPILHLLVDTSADFVNKYPDGKFEKYITIDDARRAGIGAARVELDKRLKKEDILFRCKLMRRICDHIASMTDHYAMEEYKKLYG